MLSVQNISFSYGTQAVLDAVTFKVPGGKLCGLFGPNGAGKTTLFKCCLNHLKTGRGVVTIDGQRTSALSVKKLARKAAYVPQGHRPPFPFKVKDVVLMGRTPHLQPFSMIRRQDQHKAMQAMDALSIRPLADRFYNQLSGGQRQLVLIARAVAQESPLMLLDEPTSGLDFSNQIKIWQIMRGLAHEGKTILACSHDPNHVLWFCDEVIVLHQQHIVAHGAPAETINVSLMEEMYHQRYLIADVHGATVILPRDIANRTERRP